MGNTEYRKRLLACGDAVDEEPMLALPALAAVAPLAIADNGGFERCGGAPIRAKGAAAPKRVARVARPEHAALMDVPPVATPATPSMHEALLLRDKPYEDPSLASSDYSSSSRSSSSSNSFEGTGRSKVAE